VDAVDLAPEMIEHARKKLPPDLAERVTFRTADAARLPFEDGAFDLVVLANMIPFFDELARVTAPGGAVALSFSRGAETPIYVRPERVRNELVRRGFAEFADFRVGDGIALLARRDDGR
jgi:ubiquinone/menaquinone biosynthesis C-methylase UbiE